MSTRHFLTLLDFSKEELMQVIKRGSELRLMQHEGVIYQPFVGRTLGMIFENRVPVPVFRLKQEWDSLAAMPYFYHLAIPSSAVANRLKIRHVLSHAWSISS